MDTWVEDFTNRDVRSHQFRESHSSRITLRKSNIIRSEKIINLVCDMHPLGGLGGTGGAQKPRGKMNSRGDAGSGLTGKMS